MKKDEKETGIGTSVRIWMVASLGAMVISLFVLGGIVFLNGDYESENVAPTGSIIVLSLLCVTSLIAGFSLSIVHLNKYKEKALAIVSLVIFSLMLFLMLVSLMS